MHSPHGRCWRRLYCPPKTLHLTPSSWWPSSVRNWTMQGTEDDPAEGTGFQPGQGETPGLNAIQAFFLSSIPFLGATTRNFSYPYNAQLGCSRLLMGQLWVCTRLRDHWPNHSQTETQIKGNDLSTKNLLSINPGPLIGNAQRTALTQMLMSAQNLQATCCLCHPHQWSIVQPNIDVKVPAKMDILECVIQRQSSGHTGWVK